MMANGESERQLKHELGNVRQQKKALQHLLGKASDQIEQLVAKDCDDADKEKALKAAECYRRAASL